MPQIVITNLFNKSLSINEQKSLLNGIQEHHVDWMHACGGKGRCTTCKAQIMEGEENISPLSRVEMNFREKGLLELNERLVCQCRLLGDATVRIPDENKFPHMKYSD